MSAHQRVRGFQESLVVMFMSVVLFGCDRPQKSSSFERQAEDVSFTESGRENTQQAMPGRPSGNGDLPLLIPQHEQKLQRIEGEKIQFVDLEIGSGSEFALSQAPIYEFSCWHEDGSLINTSLLNERGVGGLWMHWKSRPWQLGLKGMRIGGRRLLYLQSEYAFGEVGSEEYCVEPNEPLVVFIHLLDTVEPLVDAASEHVYETSKDEVK